MILDLRFQCFQRSNIIVANIKFYPYTKIGILDILTKLYIRPALIKCLLGVTWKKKVHQAGKKNFFFMKLSPGIIGIFFLKMWQQLRELPSCSYIMMNMHKKLI
jgi:hypothetical protein